jgi:hypothetical protein
VSTSSFCSILAVVRLLLGRLIAERSGDRQPNRHDDREEHDASRSGKKSGAEHKHCVRVPDFRLVQKRVAFDNNKCDSRGPEAKAHELAAHATLW